MTLGEVYRLKAQMRERETIRSRAAERTEMRNKRRE